MTVSGMQMDACPAPRYARARELNPRISHERDTDKMAIHCALCGANLALVGRAHRCIPRANAKPADDDPAYAPVPSVTHTVCRDVPRDARVRAT
jgi:hypothetical protein